MNVTATHPQGNSFTWGAGKEVETKKVIIKKPKKNKGRKKRIDREERIAERHRQRTKHLKPQPTGGKPNNQEVNGNEDPTGKKEEEMEKAQCKEGQTNAEQEIDLSEKEKENMDNKGNQNLKEVQEMEEDEPKAQGWVAYEGPRTKEEQHHHDILTDALEWKNEEKEPDTAKLVTEMLGTDSFEMEVDE